jgi:cytoskeleton protein RodZ
MSKRVLPKTDQTTANHGDPKTHFGNYLKTARKNQGLSLEDVSRRTGIKTAHLEALEEGDRRRLPADVFNRGFIRLYADALNIDSKEALHNYEKEWGFSNGMRGAETFLSGEQFSEAASPLADRQVLTFLFIVFLAAAGFLAYKIFLPQHKFIQVFTGAAQPTASQKTGAPAAANKPPSISLTPPETAAIGEKPDDIENVGKSAPSTPDQVDSGETSHAAPDTLSSELEEINHQTIYTPDEPAESDAPVAQTDDEMLTDNGTTDIPESADSLSERPGPVTEEALQGKTAEAAVQTGSPALAALPQPERIQNEPYVLKARFTEKTWLRISLDDQDSAEYLFQPDETYTWKAETKIKLFLGNAGGVSLLLNEVPIELHKSTGQTLKLTLP